MMFNLGLVNNAALLLALVLIYDIFVLERRSGHPARKILVGFIFGIIGVAVMTSSWVFAPGVIFDTRSVILSVGGLFLGPIPTVIAVVMTAAFRLLQGGDGVIMGISVILMSGAFGLAWRRFRHGPIWGISFYELYMFGLAVTIFMLLGIALLPRVIALDVLSTIAVPVLLIYPLATLMTGGLMKERLLRTRDQQTLLETAARYRNISAEFNAVLDGIPDNITLMSPDLKILWANTHALNRAKMGQEELTGRKCYQVWHNIAEPCSACPVAMSFKTGKPEVETVTALDKRIREIRAVPVLEDGRVVHVVEVSRDVTEHKKYERQIIQAQKIESIGTLAGGVAHDFNNILTAIIGYGNMALMKLDEHDPLRKNIENILKGADRAAFLTKELLVFSRKQAGEQKMVDIIDCIRNVEKKIKLIIRENIVYKTVLQEAPLPVLADSAQLEQILMNLATNALDAMPNGGVFMVTAKQVTLNEAFTAARSYGKPGDYALITVSDNGEGMDEETLSHIFEPFFSTREVGKGTGLGLAVVYGIIKLHDGHLNVYSEQGKGTTFSIYLPVMEKTEDEAEPPEEEGLPGRGSETVLLADDDAFVRTLCRVALKQFGYKVIEAADGLEAVDRFMENREEIQLLLLDEGMPMMNGRNAYREIVKAKPGIKVIFFSGYAPDVVCAKDDAGQDIHMLFKPLSPLELLRKIRNVLDGANGYAGMSGATAKDIHDIAP
jgi:signal transduction histidine kinase/CheY-like chemotaxis protein